MLEEQQDVQCGWCRVSRGLCLYWPQVTAVNGGRWRWSRERTHPLHSLRLPQASQLPFKVSLIFCFFFFLPSWVLTSHSVFVSSPTLDTVQKQLKCTRIWGSQSCTTHQSFAQTIWEQKISHTGMRLAQLVENLLWVKVLGKPAGAPDDSLFPPKPG